MTDHAPAPGPDHDITELLHKWQVGEQGAEAALLERVHQELRQVAAAYLRRERADETPTSVVNEVYLRLVPQRRVRWVNRSHFFGIAAQMMRRVLVDYARRRHAGKRAHTTADPASLDAIPAPSGRVAPIDVLGLREALHDLAARSPRKADIVRKRYFEDLTIEEIATVMRISPATVKREWAVAILWLRGRLSRTVP